MVVNASGIWGQGIAAYADLNIRMFPAKGALLVMGHRINKMVINRCRKPADADILVPGDTICVIGTTSSRIPYDQIDNMVVTLKKWIFYSAKVKSWRLHCVILVYYGLMPEYDRSSPPMTILLVVTLAVALCCLIMQNGMGWKALSPLRVEN